MVPEALFLSPYQMSILNLFALKRMNELEMDTDEANDLIESLIRTQAHGGSDEMEGLFKMFPRRLGSRSCEGKFTKLCQTNPKNSRMHRTQSESLIKRLAMISVLSSSN